MTLNSLYQRVDGGIFNQKLKPIIRLYLKNHEDVSLGKVSRQLFGFIRLQNLMGDSNPVIEEVINYLSDYPLIVSALIELDYTKLTFEYTEDLVYLNQFKHTKKRVPAGKESRDHEFLRKIGGLTNGN